MAKRKQEKTRKTAPTRARVKKGAKKRAAKVAVPAKPKGPPRAQPKGWRQAQRDKDTLARCEKVIELLKVHGVINVACRQALVAGRGLSKRTFYEMREQFIDFREEAQDAIDQAVEELEASGMACARMAQKDPRYIPMLKMALQVKAGWVPKSSHELTGPGGGPLHVRAEAARVDVDGLDDEDVARLYQRMLKGVEA